MKGVLRNSRRGSVIAEASMVLPLLILSVLTCLLVCMFFYDTTLQQCRLHQLLRCEADELTGHTVNLSPPVTDEDLDEDALTVSGHGVFKTVSGKEHIVMIDQGILHSKVSSDIESLWHASDGVTYVRYFTCLKDLREDK